jgi:hypothetical protein
MLFSQIAFSAVLVGSAVATSLNERFVDDGFNALTKRQQFIPTTQTAAGDTCADAFGAGYLTCREKTDSKNRLCYNPTLGQACCESTWACPNGSFCLVDPYCCPNGEDPSTCAAEKGVTLSSTFVTPSATKVAAATVNSTSYAPTSYYHVPYPTANVTSAVVNPISTGGYVTPVAFPGAASHASVSFALAFAGILGAAATLF